MTIIDAHSHLWLKQDTIVDGQHLYTTTRGRSMFFDGERQMLPPFKSNELTDAEKAAFLGENAVKLYGFKDLTELPYIKNMSE